MLAICTTCNTTKDFQPRAIKANEKRNSGKFVCLSCKLKLTPRPQNQPGFWSQPHLREKLSTAMKSSEAFKVSRKVVSEKLTGEGNPQFGKKSTESMTRKRSASMTGKFGEQARAWKGGKRSLNSVVKAAVNRRHQWAKGIYERDGWKCVKCESTKQLDAHHTTPFATLLNNINSPKLDGSALIDYLANHPALVNASGETLCRKCHKAVHLNWGSHLPETDHE